MKRFLRLGLFLVPLGLGLLSRIPAGSATVVIPPRYVDYDTSGTGILRDTLDIHFDRIFFLADSLRCTPDTLRALAIRYGFALERLVFLTDSMHVRDINQLGERIEETRGLILSSAGQPGVTFNYGSSYTTQQTTNSWSNTLDYQWVQGTHVVKNKTTVFLQNSTGGTQTVKSQQRSSETSIGLLLSPRVSVGGRLKLNGSERLDKSINGFGYDNTDLQFSLESKHEPTPGMQIEFNMFEGLTSQDQRTSLRTGYLGEVDGTLRYERGNWLASETRSTLSGSHLRTTTAGMAFHTADLQPAVNGSVSLFQAAPISARLDYKFENPHTEQVPAPTTQNPALYILGSTTKNRSLHGTMRLQKNSDTYMDFDGQLSDNLRPTSTGASNLGVPDAVATSNDRSATLDGNTTFWGWSLNATFTVSRHEDDTPRFKSGPGIYGELGTTNSRSLEANLTRPLTPRLTARLNGSIALDSNDYSVNTSGASATPDHDSPRQSWRAEATYTATETFRHTVTLEVSRYQDLNISGQASSSNTENRNYRAGWQWTARPLTGLTVNQNNSINAGYTRQLFNPSQNRLALHYSTVTTLNAVITPHLSLDVTHNADVEPSGAYRFTQEGVEAFSPSGDAKSYVLNANVKYTTSPALAINLNPVYYFRSNDARTNGLSTLQRKVATLTVQGGAQVNIAVAGKGRVTGNIGRLFNDQGTTDYSGTSGPRLSRTEYDYWTGNLQFSWKL